MGISTCQKACKGFANNSTFEMIKVEKVSDSEKYLVEARFALNLYDETGKLYRLENGFLRILTDMKPLGGL